VKKPTAEDIKKYREEKEVSLYEAKAVLGMEYIKGELAEIRQVAGAEMRGGVGVGSAFIRLVDLLIYTIEQKP